METNLFLTAILATNLAGIYTLELKTNYTLQKSREPATASATIRTIRQVQTFTTRIGGQPTTLRATKVLQRTYQPTTNNPDPSALTNWYIIGPKEAQLLHLAPDDDLPPTNSTPSNPPFNPH